jgi:hypothetical protein
VSRAAAAIAAIAMLAPLAAAAAAGDDGNLKAIVRLEPQVAGIEELMSFSITVEAAGFSGLSITPQFELDNLEVVAGPFQSRSQRWVNGETSNSVQLTWRLRAKAVGTARVRSIRVVTAERTLELGERLITIQKDTPPERARPSTLQRGGDPFDDLFSRAFPDLSSNRRPPPRAPRIAIKAEVTPAEVFVGQQATYTLWLYTQSDINAFQPTAIPDFKGFWVREIPQPQELKPEWVELDGERFGRVPMLRRALFPLKPGSFAIDPTEVDVVARIADIGPFGSPFGRNESLHLKTERTTLAARPLPAPPSGVPFSGPVGDVAISARLDRAALEVGQAATLTVRCTGRGNLQSLAPPNLALPPGLRGFPPRQDSSERLTDDGLVSSTEWTYVLVPERPGRFDLRSIEIPYFDPGKREYRVASAAPPALAVSGESVAAAAAPEAAAPVPKETGGAGGPGAGETRRAIPGSRRFWTFAGGGAGLALLAFAATRMRGAAGTKGASARTLRAAIATAGEATTPRQAAAELEEAWRQHLAERFRIPPGTPVSSWTDRLVAERADEGAARRLTELAHELHYLRYAPELSAADRLLADALETSHRLARTLR